MALGNSNKVAKLTINNNQSNQDYDDHWKPNAAQIASGITTAGLEFAFGRRREDEYGTGATSNVGTNTDAGTLFMVMNAKLDECIDKLDEIEGDNPTGKETGKELDYGWAGSLTQIKILPNDFMPSDASSTYNLSIYDYTVAGNSLRAMSTSLDWYAYYTIPKGFKATGLTLYLQHKQAADATLIKVYEAYIDDTTAVLKGTITAQGTAGNFSQALDFTDFDSTTTNMLMLHIDPPAQMRLFGGKIDIEAY